MEVDSEGATLAPPPAPAREVKTGSELGLPVVNASGSETLRVGPEESDRDAAIDPLLTGAAPSLAMDVDPQRGAASNNETSVDQKIAPPSSAKLSGSGSALAIQTKTVHEDLVEDDSAIQTQSSIRDQREETAGSQVGGTTIVSEPQPQYHDGILSRRKSMPPSPRKPIESLPPAPPALISSKPSLLPSSSPHQSGRSMADVTAVSHANSSFESTGAFQQQQPDGPADEDDMDDGDDATVDDEGGVIRCICGYDTDDGFTIQCERCLVWQHCACFGMSQASVPDEYLCEMCDPREVNVAFAQQHQQRRREVEARKAVDTARRLSQSQSQQQQQFEQARAELWSHQQQLQQHQHQQGDQAVLRQVNNSASPHAEAQSSTPPQGQAQGRSRKPTLNLDTSQTPAMPNDQPAGKGRKKGSGAKSGRKTPAPESVVPATPTQTVRSGVAGTAGSNAADAASQGGAAAAPPNIGLSSIAEADERSMDRSEAWHTEFTPISRNLVVEPRALTSLAAAMAQYESEDADHWPTQPSSSGIGVIAPVAGPVPALDSPEDVEPWGLSAVGNECVPIAIEGPTLASLQQPTYVKHISEGAAASIFSNVMSIVPLPTEPARPWCASRTFSRPTMHGLFADSPILAGSFISEYRGELLSTAAYRANPINQYAQVGTVKPHVHMFPPPLAVAIDARRFGTEARFARASCHPNAVLRPILFTRTGEAELVKSEDADHFSSLGPSFKRPEREPELLFGIFALTDIPRTHEITLGWEWDDEHIVHLLPSLVKDPALGLPPAPPGGEGASAAALAAAAIAAKVASGVRTTERERRSAAMATLAERGEFPYANARFAASMNAVLAVLLGMSLCACIGSAVPPGGQGGTASAHNSRKQDCAIAQMLRLAQGMAPLNVVMPGNKTHRKIRQPDFLPLVGVRRWWRPLSLTPTPEMTPDEVANRQRDLLLHHLDVPYKRTPTGHVGRVGEEDYLRAIAELKRTAKDVRKAELLPDIEDDRRSRASSLTEPLSGLSDLDEGDDEDDVSALLSNSGTIDLRPEESDPEDAWDAPRLLPHKKRVSGTRLKATYSGDEDSDAERAGAAGRRRASKVHTTPLPTPGLPTQQTARKATVTGVRKVSKAQGLLEQTRKLKSRGRPRKEATERASPRRVKMHDDSGDEGLRPRQSSKKKWRKSGKLHEPSSPLTSAPDDGKNYSSDESLSPAPTIQRKLSTQSERRNSLKHGDQSKMEEPLRADKVMLERPDKKRRASLIPSGSESERTARSVSPEKKAGGHERSKKKRKASEATSDLSESAIKRKNAKRLAASKMAKLQEKQKRLSLADIRDSESSGEEQPKLQLSPNKRQRSNSPEKKMVRASVKAKKPRLIISTDESGLEEDLTPGATVAQVQNAASFESSPVVEEGSAFDSQVPRAMESQSRVGDLAFTQTPDTAPPPARVEPPRAKLTLAEYKKRLAERQANEAAASAAPPTPSEVPPSPLETLTAEQSRLGPPTSGVPPSGMEVQHSAVGAGDFLASRYAPPAPRPPRPATPPRSVPPSPIAQSVYSSVPPGAAPGQIPSYSSFAQRASLADFSQPPAPAQSQMTVDASTGRQQLNVGTGMHSPQTGFAPDHVRADSSFVNDDVRSRGDSMSPRKSVSGAWLMGNATSPVRAAPPAPLASDHIGADGAGNRSIFRPGFRPVVPPSPIASDMPSLRPPQTPTSAPRPPAAPAAFNPPRGPKALINASAPTASPSVAAASSAFSGRSEDISPIVGARRMHSNSVSNASASSMSPPAHGSRLPSAATGPPGNPVDVGGSRSSSGSFSVEPGAPPGTYAARPTAIDDFAGVPRGPRGSEDGFVDASHTIPAPREGAGAGIASGSPASMPFRGRGRGWMGGGSRGFPRGGGWGGRARGDMRRGRGRGW